MSRSIFRGGVARTETGRARRGATAPWRRTWPVALTVATPTLSMLASRAAAAGARCHAPAGGARAASSDGEGGCGTRGAVMSRARRCARPRFQHLIEQRAELGAVALLHAALGEHR